MPPPTLSAPGRAAAVAALCPDLMEKIPGWGDDQGCLTESLQPCRVPWRRMRWRHRRSSILVSLRLTTEPAPRGACVELQAERIAGEGTLRRSMSHEHAKRGPATRSRDPRHRGRAAG